ncbi:glutamine amidotransferase-like uncharacterized protein [Nicoletella semolina]|uniref:Glutamine amidotransferase-like uncharacterized protein n=1 Tax=Nicoletella semolina TaxID=271160 RepID=A0A4V2SJZ9_9PAST|nr:BPL-N domain-containing protein [Nicoletella semolina]MDH2925521.1 hypothetical protein [Nicoletella semolina]TCP17596.1 glutamine amidotransferase-like uncharacterized protein [Nicoletella semolina]
MQKPIAIYQDKGTSEVGIQSLLTAIPTKLNCLAHTLSASDIIQNGLSQYAALIIAGGADLPYCEKLNGKGNQIIRQFVANGGIYIGICAGAYYGCQEIDFIGKGYRIAGKRELAFFDGIAKGSLPHFTQDNYYDETLNSKAIIPIHFAKNLPFQTTMFNNIHHLYYHGGCRFELSPQTVNSTQILANYPDNTPAIISGNFGSGKYLLSGVHFELQRQPYEKIVLNHCSIEDYEQEKQLVQWFTEDYGQEVWWILNSLI